MERKNSLPTLLCFCVQLEGRLKGDLRPCNLNRMSSLMSISTCEKKKKSSVGSTNKKCDSFLFKRPVNQLDPENDTPR